MSGRWQGSTRRSRLPLDWSSRIVPRIMARDHGICYLCGQPGADTIDHIQPGDNHTDTNLAAVHDRTWPHCHRYKSSREGNTARHRYRDRRSTEPHPGTITSHHGAAR